jgi:hypothetical protein
MKELSIINVDLLIDVFLGKSQILRFPKYTPIKIHLIKVNLKARKY